MSTMDRPAVSAGSDLLGGHLQSWLGTWPATCHGFWVVVANGAAVLATGCRR